MLENLRFVSCNLRADSGIRDVEDGRSKAAFCNGPWNSSFTGEDGDDWCEALRLLGAHAIDSLKVITHRFPLEELMKGFGYCGIRRRISEKSWLLWRKRIFYRLGA